MWLVAPALVLYLAVAGLTWTGAMRRGQSRRLGLVAGLVAGLGWPVTWAVWYVHDDPAAVRRR